MNTPTKTEADAELLAALQGTKDRDHRVRQALRAVGRLIPEGLPAPRQIEFGSDYHSWIDSGEGPAQLRYSLFLDGPGELQRLNRIVDHIGSIKLTRSKDASSGRWTWDLDGSVEGTQVLAIHVDVFDVATGSDATRSLLTMEGLHPQLQEAVDGLRATLKAQFLEQLDALDGGRVHTFPEVSA